MYAGKVKKEKNFSKSKKEEVFPNNKIGKNFSKAIDEVYNPVEEILDDYYFEYENESLNPTLEDKILNNSEEKYTFEDMYSIEKLLDSYLNGKGKKLSEYDALRLCRMFQFVCVGMKRIAKTYKTPDNKENITPENYIFFKYIANGKYKDIEDELCKLYELYLAENTDVNEDEDDDEDIRAKKALKDYQNKKKNDFNKDKVNINEEVASEIKKMYSAYTEGSKTSDNSDGKAIKKYAKAIKKMLSTTFIPRYSTNVLEDKLDYELIYDKELCKKLEEENKDGKIDNYIKNPIFMNLLSAEERIKLIRTYKGMLKRNEKSNINEDQRHKIQLSKKASKQKKDNEPNSPEAITFDPDYKNKKNVTYIKSGVIKNSEGNFTLHKIGKPTTESDKPKDKPVFEAHSASNGTGAKSEITHCFIRFRATEYDPDETLNSNPDEISEHSPYKRKVYSLGFYPSHYGDYEEKSGVKETSFFRRLANKAMGGEPSERGLIKDDSEHYSQIAITRKCDNKKISQLDKCIHNFAGKERYNLALNNCTAFVSKISRDIGYKDISNLFRSFVLYSPNLAAGKLVDAMMSGKYKRDEDTSFKTEDFVNKLFDTPNASNEAKHELLKAHGKDFFSKKSSHGILYEMIHLGRGYTSSDTDIEKEDVAGLGEIAYKAFLNTYDTYIEPFYGPDKKSQKNKDEISRIFAEAASNFIFLKQDKENFENPHTQENEKIAEENRKKYFASLDRTQKAMEKLRKIALKHKNIRAFLMANCFVDRIIDEKKKNNLKV